MHSMFLNDPCTKRNFNIIQDLNQDVASPRKTSAYIAHEDQVAYERAFNSLLTKIFNDQSNSK